MKVWNVEEGVLAAQTEVILPETYALPAGIIHAVMGGWEMV